MRRETNEGHFRNQKSHEKHLDDDIYLVYQIPYFYRRVSAHQKDKVFWTPYRYR